MKRRKCTPELKTKIVLEGLRGRPLAEEIFSNVVFRILKRTLI
jgi:hypothetical protein